MGTLIHTQDKRLYDSIAQEVNKLAGALCRYYVLDKVNSVRDPLYDEPEVTTYELQDDDGLEIPCFVQNPPTSLSTGEEGRRTQWDTTIWIARVDWEDCTGNTDLKDRPKHGDVVNIWDEYYDVIQYDRDGVINDHRPDFVLWKLDLRRNTKFEPQRRPDKLPLV